jgi:2-polyprenyl-6-methoxyphenol hydroxylase-like FAD-dependent oxidoreductase
MTADGREIPVAIVGGGPVGLMLALFLDFYGVRSVVFNSEPDVRRHPKGSTHNSRTMEHHRRLGIAPRVRDLSLPMHRPTDVSYYTTLTGWELGRIPMPSEAEKRRAVANSAATDQTPEPLLRANQMYVEAFLFAHARTRPNITIRFGWPVVSFQEDDGGVTVVAERATDGAKETWRAQYLAGCDGGRSFARRSLALKYHGFASLDSPHYGGQQNATYFRAPTLYRDHLAHRPGWNYWIVHPKGRCTIISLNDDQEFLAFSKALDDTPPTDEGAISTIQRGVGTDLPISIIGHWPWTAGVALVAERFATRRVVLAGDAVHLFTPTGGFGMNTGMDDASNLAWKLAAMVQGWGGASLLQSYESERKPIAHRNTIAARELNKQLAGMPPIDGIEEDTPAGEATRRSVSAHLAHMTEEYASLGVQLGARYDGSPVVAQDGAPPADDYVNYTPSGVPGGRAPHYWMGSGRGIGDSLYDRLGKGFTLLRLGGKAADSSAIEAAARQRGVPLAVLDVPAADARDLYGRDLALIRPDQYIAWSGNIPPADADKLIARATGGT